MADDNSTQDIETQSVELSSVLVTITNKLLRDANEGEPTHEHLTIRSVLEEYLASELTLDDVERVARTIPSVRDAFRLWLTARTEVKAEQCSQPQSRGAVERADHLVQKHSKAV